MDRELRQELFYLIGNGVEALTSIADTIKKAIEEPQVEIEVPPPTCPHCNQINPRIIVSERGQVQGEIGSYVLVATCLHCKKTFYAIPLFWNGFRKSVEAQAFAEDKLKGVNNATAGNPRKA